MLCLSFGCLKTGFLLWCRIEEMRKAESGHSSDKARVLEELEEARERLDAERAAQRLASERVEATTREVELLRADLAATKQNLEKAEADKTRVRQQPLLPPPVTHWTLRYQLDLLHMKASIAGMQRQA